jgi:hypothetical protein
MVNMTSSYGQPMVWSADANVHRDVPIWFHTVATEELAERLVKQWIDEQQLLRNR